MLVLTRGMKQQIVIDNGLVTVTVLEIRGGRVRIGVEAPAHVNIRRQEIQALIAPDVESVDTHDV